MAQMDYGWVDGFPPDGDEFGGWLDRQVPPPHHRKWDEALQVALDDKTAGWPEGKQGEFTLTFRVRVTKRNPGWIDGYKVDPSG
jgi:hypothetical protein